MSTAGAGYQHGAHRENSAEVDAAHSVSRVGPTQRPSAASRAEGRENTWRPVTRFYVDRQRELVEYPSALTLVTGTVTSLDPHFGDSPKKTTGGVDCSTPPVSSVAWTVTSPEAGTVTSLGCPLR